MCGIVGGTTGEGTSLTINERKQLAEAWAKAVKETKQHLMVQIGGTTLVDVKELVSEFSNCYYLFCTFIWFLTYFIVYILQMIKYRRAVTFFLVYAINVFH